MKKINQNKLDLPTLIGHGVRPIDYKYGLICDVLPQILIDHTWVALPVNLKNTPIWN